MFVVINILTLVKSPLLLCLRPPDSHVSVENRKADSVQEDRRSEVSYADAAGVALIGEPLPQS
jgi:hypothetical protein